MPGATIGFRLLVGLGNPGSQYAETRHNAGFWFIDAIAREFGVSMKPESRFFGEVGKMQIGTHSLYLLKPAEFMNLSGRSVATLSRFYKIPVDKILVGHDELDLDPGIIRLKNGGGHGGHNGLRDVVPKLGSAEFWRLRIGIGHPGHKSAVSGYVLKKPQAEDRNRIEAAIDLVLRTSTDMITGDINVATKTLHSHKPLSSQQS